MDLLLQFCRDKGLDQFSPELDGVYHEIKTDRFKGWYIGSEDVTASGAKVITFTLGDWRTGERHSFVDFPTTLTKEERAEFNKKRKEEEKRAKAAASTRHAEVSVECAKKFVTCVDGGESTYLTKKRIKKFAGVKVVKNSWGKYDLLIPMYDVEGKLWGLQTIEGAGDKQFHLDQRIEGLHLKLGALTPKSRVLYICEGYATAASIHEATGEPTVVAFNAENLSAIGTELRVHFPEVSFVFCADNDIFARQNFGKIKALRAASLCRGQVLTPKFKNLANQPTDFNDLHVEEGLEAVTQQLADFHISPIDDIIVTEATGFHFEEVVRGVLIHTPDPDGLRKFFDRQKTYLVMGESRILYVWNGKHYEAFGDAWLAEFAETRYVPKPNNKTVAEFTQKVLRTNIKPVEWFSTSIDKKLNFQNGVLDLITKTFHPHSKEYGFRYVLPFNYDPAATAPLFEKFLHDVMDGDPAPQITLKEFSGYAFSGDSCWLQKALILDGDGRNGKSTFIDTLRYVIGDANCTPLTVPQLNSEHNRQMLDGKLVNLAEETPTQKLADSSVFKNLISGGMIQARQIYKGPYSMRNRAKLIFACNTLPESSDVTDAFFRRFLIIPFNVKFTHEKGNIDPHIGLKLQAEASGIFNLCFKAYENVVTNGKFTQSTSADKALKEYMRDIDPMLDWLEDHLELKALGNGADDKFVSCQKIYQEYSIFMEQSGHRPPTSNIFSRRLRKEITDFKERYSFKREKDNKGLMKTIRALKAAILHTES